MSELDLDAALDSAKLPEATVPTCLRGDLQADFEDLERRLDEANRKTSDSLADPAAAEVAELAEQLDALSDQMQASIVPIRVTALQRPEWLAMLAKYPPDEDNQIHGAYGFATEKMWPELVRVSITPKPSDATWTKLDAKLTAGQMEALGLAAAHLNRRGKVSVPKSSAVSAVLRKHGETPS